MADDINKQVQWFDHQFVRAREFQAEQAYLNTRRWLHTSGFHSAGIVDGLGVSRVGTSTSYHVAQGWAVDTDGREAIVLAPGIDVTASPSQWLWIQPRRVSTDPSGDPGLRAFDTRWDETPRILARAATAVVGTGSADVPANAILLAKLDAGGVVDMADRQEVQIRQGDTIRSRDIREADGTSGQNTNVGSGVKTGHIQDAAVTDVKIAANSIRSAHIVVADAGNDQTATTGNGVKTAHIKDAAVTPTKIAPLAIQSAHVALADAGTDQTTTTGNGVKRDHIKNDAVNQDKIAALSVQSRQLALADAGTDQTTTTGSGVKTQHIKDGAITNAKIADGTIAPAKLDLTLPFPATTVMGEVVLWNQDPAVLLAQRVPLRWIAANRGAVIGSLDIQRIGTAGGRLAVQGAAVVDEANLNTGSLVSGLSFGQSSGEGIASKRNAGGNQFGLDIYTNNVARLSVSNAGNVGIATASPQRRLHVNGTEIHSGGTGGGLSFGDRVATEFPESVAGDRWVWYSSGRRARLWTAVNGDLLSVEPAGHVTLDLRDTNNGTVGPGLAFGALGTGEGIASKRTAGGNRFGLDFYTQSQARLSITNTGSVGIGTTSPQRLLHVHNSEIHSGGGGGGFSFGDRVVSPFVEAVAGDRWVLYSQGRTARLWTSVNGDLITVEAGGQLNVDTRGVNNGNVAPGIAFGGVGSGEGIASKRTVTGNRFGLDFYTNFAQRMAILNNGRIGVGTNAPDSMFHVAGEIRATNFVATNFGGKLGYVLDQFVNRLGEALEEGDVVVLGQTEPTLSWGTTKIPIPEVDLAQQAYDSRVCGIVAQTWSEIRTGADGDEETVHALTPAQFAEIDEKKVEPGQIGTFVTLGAFATCKVDADAGPIAIGDLLTTSATPGHAQKVLDESKATGAILGKAMGALEKGKGQIPVLVLLH